MKNAHQIISSIQSKPQFKKLKKFQCINKIKSMFLPTFSKFVKFAYLQNKTLFFVLNHNAGKQEFDNNIQNIKSALKLFTPIECENEEIHEIKAFVTHTPRKITYDQPKENPTYPERATGDVQVCIQDEKLNQLANSIQKIIKTKHDT